MDAPQSKQLSPRRRRALIFASLAVAAIVGVSLYYLNPIRIAGPKVASLAASATPLSRLDTFTSYNFESTHLGWALAVTATPSNQVPFRIFRTADGARHWQSQLVGQTSSVGLTLHSFQFLDPTHGFVAVGNPSSLFRTTDGGMHWLALGLPYSDGYAVTFADPLHGWFLAWTTVYPSPNQVPHLSSTSDGGNTWNQLPDPPVDFGLPIFLEGHVTHGVTFRTRLEGWLGSTSAGQPHVYSSADGGQSWHRREVPLPSGGVATSTFSTDVLQLPGNGVMATVNPIRPSALFTSFDDGMSWSKVTPLPLGVGTGDLGFLDNLDWWQIHGGTLSKSSDGGQTWNHIADKLPNAVYSLHILDSKHAWAQVFFAEGSGLAFTADGGLNWTRANIPPPT
jgi:photosystem II stability/assembly factor-like uncharacterized protein